MNNKKIILIITFILLLFPFGANATTCDPEKVNITSITLEEKSEKVEELEEAKAEGRNINVNLRMTEVGDSIRYKIEVSNESDDEYEINEKSFGFNTDYLNYSIESEDESNVVKGKSTKTFYLKVEYKNEVPENLFVNGVFNDNSNMLVSMSTEKEDINETNIETINNPNTGDTIILFIAIFITSLIVLIILVRKMKISSNMMILLVGSLLLLPLSVSALCCTVEIEIKSTVEIVKPKQLVNYIVFYNDAETGEELVSPKTVEGLELGTSISESAIEIDGYKVKEPSEITLEIKEGENYIEFLYERIYGEYIVFYKDLETGEELSSSKTFEGLELGTSITESAIKIDGYKQVEPIEITIEIEEGENKIEFFYEKIRYVSYTVRFLDMEGNELAPLKIVNNQELGSTVIEQYIRIPNYYPIQFLQSLTLVEDNMEIVFSYKYRATEIEIIE